MTTALPQADIGVIGGSGFYSFLTEAESVCVTTPFGDPSDDLVVGTMSGRRVAFLGRHGADHRFPPHLINYRANMWALRSVGVRQILAPSAVGSLDASLGPGAVVVPDQLMDRTSARAHTVYDHVGPVVHVSFADPYCPVGRQAVAGALAGTDTAYRVGGTLVVVNGPRFSTRAESQAHQQSGCTIVGMTAMPEAAIARELAMCYTTIALVTDLDAGLEHGAGVTHQEVFKIFAQAIPGFKGLVAQAVALLPVTESDDDAICPCRRALDGLPLPFVLP